MEQDFISGRFFEDNLEKSKRYLYKYFTTDVQRQFVRYYLMFRRHDQFVEHTGHSCTQRWLKNLAERLDRLEAARDKARSEANIELLAQIESGDCPL